MLSCLLWESGLQIRGRMTSLCKGFSTTASVRASLLLISSDYIALWLILQLDFPFVSGEMSLVCRKAKPHWNILVCYLSWGEHRLCKFSVVGIRNVNNSDFGNIRNLVRDPWGTPWVICVQFHADLDSSQLINVTLGEISTLLR